MTVPVLAEAVLANASGLPEDAAINTFAFLAADLTGATLDGIAASIVSLYNTTGGQSAPLSTWLSRVLSRASLVNSVRFYDLTGALDGSPHGSPVQVNGWTLGAAAANPPLPSEVAIRATVLADGWESQSETRVNPTPPPATIRPRARYRGGDYFGPWGDSASTGSGASTLEPRVNTTLLADWSIAWTRFMDERGGDFCIWSRADATLRLVAPDGLITMDNAFDTIRKRGQAASTRTPLWP